VKKILWHLPYAIIGGVETLYATILKYLSPMSGLEHYVTCHKNIKDWVSFHYKGYAKVFPYSDIEDLSQALNTIAPDLIMGTHGMTLYQALKKTEKFPVIEIVHGSHTWVEHNSHMPKDWTVHVVCVSNSAQRNYHKTCSSKVPSSVIINGVDTEVYYPRKPFQVKAKNIGYFGRFLEEDKHLKKLIEAFRSLGSIPSTLYLVGGKPVEILELKKYVKKRSLRNPVLFFEHTNQPQRYYEKLDLCTIRSQAEGYCNSAAESLASGTPLVCYNFGGILEHVPKGTIAVGCSQVEYASKLNKVFKDAPLRREMREKGLQFAREEGSAKKMALRYYDLIHSFTKGLIQKKVDIPYLGECTINSSPVDLTAKKIVGVFTPYWHGIATATKNIANTHVCWEKNHKEIVKKIIKHCPDAVLFSGMPEGFKEAATLLRQKRPSLPIYSYYHGGVSHFSFANGIYGQGERNALESILHLAQKGVFNKIAVSSPGMEEIGKANGIPFVYCGNVIDPFPTLRINRLEGIHIGNWNRHLDHKHTSMGIAVSNLIEGSYVHMLECPYRIPSLDYSRVRFYKDMSQPELYKKYRQMTVNLQLSFIETFNISVLEMWACGSPVLVGPGNKVLIRDSSFLKEHCYVDDHTNPSEVAKKVDFIKEHREKVVMESQKNLEKLNGETRLRWAKFFSK
jgi:glycosyltransferase involved in cell wall biosynthesis